MDQEKSQTPTEKFWNNIIKIQEGKIGTRPSWQEYGMVLALAVSSRSSCHNVKAGAYVTTHDHQPLGTGYNGAPPGMQSCYELGHCHQEDVRDGHRYGEGSGQGDCIGQHAEPNALAHVDKKVHQNIILYSTIFPCKYCAQDIRSTGVSEVVFKRPYRVEESTSKALPILLGNEEGREIKIFQLDLSPERFADILYQDRPRMVFGPWTKDEIKRVRKSLEIEL